MNIRIGTIGHLRGVYTGFPTGNTRCRYLGPVNGMHTFRSELVHETAYLTDAQMAAATWEPCDT